MSNKKEEINTLEVKNVYMKYKKKDKHFALNDVNFKIEKGDFHAFIGENGAGKSTAIKIISGLNNDYQGDVFINGLNIRDNINARRGFLYIPDKNFFPSYLNVVDYLFNITLSKSLYISSHSSFCNKRVGSRTLYIVLSTAKS